MSINIVGRTGNKFSVLVTLRLYPYLVVWLAALAAGACSVIPAAESSAAGRAPSHVIVPLVYASDRAPSGDADSFGLGAERGELGFGRVRVAISTSREGASAFADWRNWEGGSSLASDLNQLDGIEPGGKLGELIEAAQTRTGNRDVLLYVHGYAKSFRRASLAFSLAVFEMDYSGVPVLFSWPSAGNPLDYSGDIERQRGSVTHLAEVIAGLLSDPNVDSLHIVAHSLGNQALIGALELLKEDGRLSEPFGEIVLFSPDYDQAEFAASALPLLETVCGRVSLYVSAKDIPLTLSRVVNRGKRLGDARGQAFTAAAIETIDVSPVAGVLEGHTTLQNDPFVQADLHFLLVQGLGAAERPTLRPAVGENDAHWEADPGFSPE